MGAYKYIDNIVIRHHWDEILNMDRSVQNKNEKFFKFDGETFEMRKKLNFPKKRVR